MRKSCAICVLVTTLAVLLALPATAQEGPPPFESYLLYLSEYPDHEENGWSENVQGISHDDNYWYITQTWELWKIPVGTNLASVDDPGGGVTYINLGRVSQLAAYNHAGDLSYYEYGGTGYLLIPLEGSPGPGLGIFRADNLQHVSHASFPGVNSAAWAAVDAQGRVYTSDDNYVNRVMCYEIDWQQLHMSETLSIQRAANHDLYLRNPQGQSMNVRIIQGGDFSDGGRLLYLSCGFYGEHVAATDGVHVFDVATGKQVAHSANGADPFNFEYDPICEFGHYSCDEPEGLTVWDMDDGRAPNVWGQLHVLVLDNDRSDWTPWDPDDVSLKHYSHTIYVDGAYDDEEKGRYWDPFNTVGEAHNYAWGGARIGIKAGVYPESLTLWKHVALFPFGGSVTIGNGGRMRMMPPATVRIYHGGAIRLQ